jgi:methionyl-tRNA formyltransferase
VREFARETNGNRARACRACSRRARSAARPQAAKVNRLPIVFMGTPELACATLRTLLDSQTFHLLAVVTQPDRPQGRDLKLQPSPVKTLALSAGLAVLQPESARQPAFTAQMGALSPELICVTAFGQILPGDLLDLPKFGCLNVHTSLLPKYRGAAPIQWALLNGEKETGVTIMKMDPGLDTGDILTQQSTPIQPEDTAQTLHDRLAVMGADLLARTIPDYVAGHIQPRPQPAEGATRARKIKKEDGRIDWSRPACSIWNQVRALVPWPGAFTFFGGEPKPHLLKVWRAAVSESSGKPGEILSADKSGIRIACGTESLGILELQLEGGRRLEAREFLAGHPLTPGMILG